MLTSTATAMVKSPVSGAVDKALRGGKSISVQSVAACIVAAQPQGATAMQQLAALYKASTPDDVKEVLRGPSKEEKAKGQKTAPLTAEFIRSNMDKRAAANATSATRAVLKALLAGFAYDGKMGYIRTVKAARDFLDGKANATAQAKHRADVGAEFALLREKNPKGDATKQLEEATENVARRAEMEKETSAYNRMEKAAKEAGQFLIGSKISPSECARRLLALYGEKHLRAIANACAKLSDDVAAQHKQQAEREATQRDADAAAAKRERETAAALVKLETVREPQPMEAAPLPAGVVEVK